MGSFGGSIQRKASGGGWLVHSEHQIYGMPMRRDKSTGVSSTPRTLSGEGAEGLGLPAINAIQLGSLANPMTAEPQPARTDKCACGTTLSRYNPNTTCNPCNEKARR